MKTPPIQYCPECHSLKRKPNKECKNHEHYWIDQDGVLKANDKVSMAVSDISLAMVKRIANMYIDVEDTSAGRSAQRFWYLQAERLIKQYISMLKLTYKNSTMTKSSKQK